MKNHRNLRKDLFISILITVLLTSGGMLYAQNVWTLRDCIDYALEYNIQVKQSELNSDAYQADLLQSKLDMLPSLNASASHSYGWGRSVDLATYQYATRQTQQNYFSVNGNITVFNGLQKYNAIKQNLYNYLASKYDSDKMRDDISLRIAAAYLQILFSQELVEQAKEQLEVTNQQVSRTQKLVNAGTLPQGDLYDMQSRGASDELTLINYQNQVTLAYLDLLQLLDMSLSEKFEIEKPDFEIIKEPELIPSEQIYRFALDNLPQIKSAEFSLKSAEKGLSIAKGYRSPTLSLRGGWGTNYSDQIIYTDHSSPDYGKVIPFSDQFNDNQNKTLSLSLSIPIYNGLQVSTMINKSRLQSINSQYNLDLQKNQVRKTVEQAYTDALASFKACRATQKSLISFKEAFKYMEQKFNVGLVNSIDYNVAKTQLSKAESDLLTAKYDFIFKMKVLDFYMGKPITLEEYSK